MRRFPTGRLVWLLIGSGCALGLLVTVLAYRADLRKARDRIRGVSSVAETRCGTIEYASRGSGAPVLVVHGAGGGFDQGLDIAGWLADQGFRVIAISRFGYLQTPLPDDASPAAQADLYACLLDHLGVRQTAIFGASAGGPSTLQFAIRYPERTKAVILLVPATYVPRPGRETSVRTPSGVPAVFDTALRSDFLFWAIGRLARPLLFRTILGTPPEVTESASPAERAELDRLLDHVLPVTSRRVGLLNDGRIVTSLERYALEKIHAPALLISFRDDLYGTYDGAEYTAKEIRGARFLGFETGGHLGLGHSRDVHEAVARHLRGSRENRQESR